MPKKLTWEKLETLLPLLNTKRLEIETGLRAGRIRDVKHGKSRLSEEELEVIRTTLRKHFT